MLLVQKIKELRLEGVLQKQLASFFETVNN